MKTLAVVILDKFADWEPALLAAGLQSIIGGYTVRWASVDREVKTSMGGLRVEPDMTIPEIPSTADAVIVIGAEGSCVLCPPKIPSSSPQSSVISGCGQTGWWYLRRHVFLGFCWPARRAQAHRQ